MSKRKKGLPPQRVYLVVDTEGRQYSGRTALKSTLLQARMLDSAFPKSAPHQVFTFRLSGKVSR